MSLWFKFVVSKMQLGSISKLGKMQNPGLVAGPFYYQEVKAIQK